jgi:hypothetical protein
MSTQLRNCLPDANSYSKRWKGLEIDEVNDHFFTFEKLFCFQLCEEIWEKHFFAPLIPVVAQSCCNLIRAQHNHQQTDLEHIKTIIEIYGKL